MTKQDRITYLKYRKVILNQMISESLDILANGGPLSVFAAERRIATQDQLLFEVTKELKMLLKNNK